MADDDFPSIDIEKLIELWQQEECMWNISSNFVFFAIDLKLHTL